MTFDKQLLMSVCLMLLVISRKLFQGKSLIGLHLIELYITTINIFTTTRIFIDPAEIMTQTFWTRQ